jgi:hypothetical protein
VRTGTGDRVLSEEVVRATLREGRATFCFDAFGDEAFRGDQLERRNRTVSKRPIVPRIPPVTMSQTAFSLGPVWNRWDKLEADWVASVPKISKQPEPTAGFRICVDCPSR